MAKLSDVLGGLLRDLADSRVAADSLSKQYAEAYGQDALLRHFPVPRVAVKDVTLRLRFAISGQKVALPTAKDKAYAETQWTSRVIDAVLPAVLDSNAAADAATADRLRAKLTQLAVGRDLGVNLALGGQWNTALKRTVALLVSARNALPAKVRAKLPAERAFAIAAQRSVKQALDEYVPATLQVIAARAALRSEIDIVLTKAELEKIPDSQLQELTVTLAGDDVLLGPQPPAPTR